MTIQPATVSLRSSDEPDTLPLTPLNSATKLPIHIPALDGVRGLAVLLILFCHATQRPYLLNMDQIYSSHIDKIVLLLARISWAGVDLFFVLSGFLITGILFDAKGKNRYFTNFYARRTVRIFPLYYAFLIVFLVIWPHLPAALSEGFGPIKNGTIWYWLYLSNYAQAIAEQAGRVTDHPVHVSWSLAIEEQFYLCWPLVVFLCRRETLLKVCVGMFFGSMLLRAFALPTHTYLWAMNFTPTRVDALAVGAMIALVARGPLGIGSLVRPAKFVFPISMALLVSLIVVMSHLGYHRGVGQSPGYVLFGTALISLAFGSLLIWAIISPKGTVGHFFFTHPFFRTFGKYSYAVYLLHMPILILIHEYVFRPDMLKIHGIVLPGLIVYSAITWTLSLCAALLSWHLLEKHFLKLKDYFPMEKKAGSAAAWEGADVSDAEPSERAQTAV